MTTNNDQDERYHLRPQPSRISRPFAFFHPTHAVLLPANSTDSKEPSDASHWSSRASRKNRYTAKSAALHHHDGSTPSQQALQKHPSAMVVQQRLRHPHSRLKVHLAWDVSFWVAIAFVLGSAAWICNGHLLYTPLSPTPSPMHQNAAAWLAFVGGTCFEIGAYLAYVESLPANTGHTELYEDFRKHLAKTTGKDPVSEVSSRDGSSAEDGMANTKGRPKRFRWFGTGSIRDIGFLANSVQLFAASVFWVSTVTGLPNVIPTLTEKNTAVSVVLYWTPQVIGGTGFIVASILLMLEEQKSWWKLAPLRIGWQVAVWNLVGAVGFTLCGALGYAAASSTKANYQSVLSTFWGSWAFMIGSSFQLWEALWREDPATSAGDAQGEKDQINGDVGSKKAGEA